MEDKKETKYEVDTHDYIKRHLKEMRNQELACGSIKFDKQFIDSNGFRTYSRDYRITISVNIEIRTEKLRR